MANQEKIDQGLVKVRALIKEEVTTIIGESTNSINNNINRISKELDEFNEKDDYRQQSLLVKIGLLENEVKHLNELVEKIEKALGTKKNVNLQSTTRSASVTVVVDSEGVEEVKEPAPTPVRRATSSSKKNELTMDKVNDIITFCSWKWLTDPSFKEKYGTPEVMEEINKVGLIKNTKDPHKKLCHEGKAFYTKIVAKASKLGNNELPKEIDDLYANFTKQFENLPLDKE